MKGARMIAPFGLRMPDDVKKWVSDLAGANGRSMNTEIVRILRERIRTTAGESLAARPAVVPNEPSDIGQSTPQPKP